MMDWGNNAGWWNGGMIFMGLFWLALIAFAIWAVLHVSRRRDDATSYGVESPRHILDRRFAAGEIDAETYAERRRVLEGHSIDQKSR